MKGKNHERLNLALLPFITFLIGVFGSRKYQLIILSFLILFFVIRYLIATSVGTPDLDTISRATKRLWIIGWIFQKVFRHKQLHGFWMWTGIFLIEWAVYSSLWNCGWLAFGGYLPVVSHLLTDKL